MNDTLLFIIFMLVTLAQIAVVVYAYLTTRRDFQKLRVKQAELDELRRQLEPLPPPLDDLSERIRL